MTIDSYIDANTILFIISLFILLIINILFTKCLLKSNIKIIRSILFSMILVILFLIHYNINHIDIENILLNGNVYILYMLIIILKLFNNDSFNRIFIRIAIYTILAIITISFVSHNIISKILFSKIYIIFINMFIISIIHLFFLKKLSFKK